ncbi:2-oxoglutarate dehydrogenase complex E2 component [Brettanomyces bruxellensis]|nr:2-oxoglutarate dehydrogenase complex E2 component [Brettanomyces bruxellensis]
MLRTSLRQSIKSMRVTSMKGCLSRGAPLVLSKRYLQTFSSPVLGSAKRAQVSRNMFPNNLTFTSSFQLKFARGEATIIKVPEMAESITEGTLASFTKKVGDYIGQDELLATIETDKIDVEVNSPVGGTVRELLANPDDDVEVGQDLAKIEPGPPPAGGAKPAETEPSKPDEEAPKAEAATEKPAPKPKAASIPAAAAVAASAPKPTSVPSPSSSNSEPAPAAKSSVPPPTAPRVVSPYGQFSRSEERIKMNRMRRRIAERLKTAQNTAASLTTFNEVDMTSIMEMRKLYKDEFLKKTGIKMGFMGPFSKACTLAAKDFPSVGAAIENDDTLVYRDYMDISVAVATPKGLVTPVVRNAESLSILDIEAEISNLAKKARDGKLSLEDLAGGTFTISNGGIFGSLYGTPIINSPQTAVLGLHGIKQRPVTVNGKIESRPMMYLALTYDHRVLDGREAVSFLRTVKELIEDPRKMLLM